MAAMKLTDDQKQAVDALSTEPEHAGESKLAIFRSLPTKAKATYFRDHFLMSTLGAIIVIALAAFMIVKAVTPASRPKLYAAVIDNAITTTEAQQLQQKFSVKLGRDVNIDSYFDTNKDGLSKLQTMLAAKQIDVIIAPQSEFKKTRRLRILQQPRHLAQRRTTHLPCRQPGAIARLQRRRRRQPGRVRQRQRGSQSLRAEPSAGDNMEHA